MQIKRNQNSLKRYCFIESDNSIHPEGIPGDYSSKLFSLSFFLLILSRLTLFYCGRLQCMIQNIMWAVLKIVVQIRVTTSINVVFCKPDTL